MLNVLVTSLCLQGNKGGPALALSLMSVIRRYLSSDARFCFVVPLWDFRLEQKWSLRYGVSVVPTVSVKDLLPPWQWQTRRMASTGALSRAMREADIIVDSSGIAFVGPPDRSGKSAILGAIANHLWTLLASRYNKPLFRWTQSYGPFAGLFVPFIARREFARAPFLMARGYVSRHRLRQLGVKCPVYEFPDVAFCLPAAKEEWAQTYLHGRVGVPSGKHLIGLSPSAVLRSYPSHMGAVGEVHIDFCASLLSRLLEPDWCGVLIPHTIRVNGPASACDLDVARQIFKQLSPALQEKVYLVEDDLDCRELKALIGRMDFFVGARYHSLVAALSMRVPTVAVGWHEKYPELLRFFGLEDTFVDARKDVPFSAMIGQVCRLFEQRMSLRNRIADALPSVLQAVDESGRVFAEGVWQTMDKSFRAGDLSYGPSIGS